jgi:hypothetical protein
MNRKQLRNELRTLARKGKISQLKKEMSAVDKYYELVPVLPKTGYSMSERRSINRYWYSQA